MWEQVRGHQNQIAAFRRAIEGGRLSQGYLLAGPSGIGKRLFAETLAASLMCSNAAETLDACGSCDSCKQVKANTHPDLLKVACPPDKREIPIELLAGSREKRGREGLCYELSLKPMIADRRIAIIDDVEKLNVASANTLLKTLEEPPARALFFLIVNGVESVLPTIRSRCQLVQFQSLPESDVRELLLQHEIVESQEEASRIAVLSGGSMDAASQLADPAVRQLSELVTDAIKGRRLDQAMALAADVMSSIEATSKDSSTQRNNAQWALRFLGSTLQRSLRAVAVGQQSGLECVPSTGPEAADIVSGMLERVIDSESHLRQSMPMLLCFESMFDDLRRIASGKLAASS
ncbi:MAG: DNA polymerase III subunit delta' [Planctomycetaceae bacterium]